MAQFPSGAAGGGDAPLLHAGVGAAGAAPPPGAGLPRPAPEPGAEGGGETASAGAGGAGEAAPLGAGLAGAEQHRVTDVSTYVSLGRTVGSRGHLGPPKDPKWPVCPLARAPLGYFYNAPHWGGAISSPPLISETTEPILKIQAAFESPGKTVEGKQILLTSGSRVMSQVRSKSKCSTFRAW